MQCDEQRPSCGLCSRVGKLCSLSPSLTVQSPATTEEEFILPSNASPVHQIASTRINRFPDFQQDMFSISSAWFETGRPVSLSPPHVQSLPIRDLELLHHQMVCNQASGTDGEDIQLGFAAPYLLHTILSCSALLLFSKQPTRTELLDLAYRHQDSALTLVGPHLICLDSTNIQAVLQFAAIMSVIALARPLYRHPYRVTRRTDPIDDILNSFLMTRGIKTILLKKWQIESAPDPDPGPELDACDPWKQDLIAKYPSYSVLRSLIVKHCPDNTDRLVCLDASRKIFSFIAMLEEEPEAHPDARLVQIWPIEIERTVIDMLAERRPISLLILGYYSALMKLRSHTMWPYHAWPKIILHRVDEVLGHEWAQHLEWPKARVLCE